MGINKTITPKKKNFSPQKEMCQKKKSQIFGKRFIPKKKNFYRKSNVSKKIKYPKKGYC